MTEARQLFDGLWRFYEQKLKTATVTPFDFVQLVTYLLFLKIDHERASRPAPLAVQVVPDGLGWPTLVSKSGDALERQFVRVLQECGKNDASDLRSRIKRTIFRKAEVPIHNPALLAALIKDEIEPRTWTAERESLQEMYAMLLEKASSGFEIGSGQTLTPLSLVSTVIDCIRPATADKVFDPACGTGSLLVAAYRTMAEGGQPFPRQSISGGDLGPEMCRFATMNFLLATWMPFDEDPPVREMDSLAQPYTDSPTVVVCNPPFTSTAPLPKGRSDLVASTSSYQLSFLQHIMRALPPDGRAAVFVPDNVLFGAGSEKTVRNWLLQHCDVHTLLRLPTGVFARGGVKTNILFFTKRVPRNDGEPITQKLWIYDFRTGQRFSAQQSPLRRAHLNDFVKCYHAAEREESDRFKVFSYSDLQTRELNLDITWQPGGEVDELLSPQLIAREIADELAAAAQEFVDLAAALPDDTSPPCETQ